MKKQKLELPSAPTYKLDPAFEQGKQSLLDYGNQLTSGNFNGDLSWLKPAISGNNAPEALLAAQGALQPQFRDTLQQISNQAAANGQLNSSTFTDALARSQSDLNSQYQSILSKQSIDDFNQSNQNRLSLFGSGLSSLGQAATFGLQNQGQENQFNLDNYDNQVAATIAGQKQNNGGFLGALTGAIGGGLGGFAVGGPIGAGIGAISGGLGGGFTPQAQNLGGSLLGSGASLYGSNMQANNLNNIFKSGFAAPAAGAYASNDLSLDPYKYSLLTR